MNKKETYIETAKEIAGKAIVVANMSFGGSTL